MDSYSHPAHRRHRPLRASVLSVLAAVVLPACASPAGQSTDAAPTAASDSHRIDSGDAAEVASPALALIIADDEGEVAVLDLESEERDAVSEPRADVASVVSDGRLVYVTHARDDGTAVEVIDTARWTAPHGDHTHSFRGETRVLGTLEGDGDAHISAGVQRATVHFADGDVVVLSHDEIGGDLDAAPRVSVDADGPVVAEGPVVAFAEHLIVPTADAALEIRDADGVPVAGAAAPCATPADADITRVGAVVTCARGAVLFTREVGGAVVGESIAFPDGAPGATELGGRTDRPDLAGVAGDRGAWLLDVRQRRWTLIPSDVPLLRAAALGDDASRTIAIDADGRVRVLAPDGTVLARTNPLLAASVVDPDLRERLQLVVDGHHAYVSDPASGAVHEIDHDDAVVTRSFTDLDPWYLGQVG